MLKKALAFGLLAASTIGFAIPAQAQDIQQSSQIIQSTTVGVNGSHVFSGNAQSSQNTIRDYDYGYGYDYDEPTFQGSQQAIGSTTVGANGARVISENVQRSENTVIDVDGTWGPYYGF